MRRTVGRAAAAARLQVQGPRFLRDVRRRHAIPQRTPVRVVGPDPIRILLFGGDYAVGWNAPSRRAALDGALADLLVEATGRGVIVENRAEPDLPLTRVAESLGATGAHTFHLAVWAPTFREAALRPARTWRRELLRTAAVVHGSSTAGLVLLGVPLLRGRTPFAALARVRATRLHRVLLEVAAGSARTDVVAPPAVDQTDIASQDGTAVYREVAVALLPALLGLLRSPRTAVR